jgi:D-alanine-D-alanine ligase
MYPLLWEHSGVPLSELVDRLVQLAVERFEDRRVERAGWRPNIA